MVELPLHPADGRRRGGEEGGRRREEKRREDEGGEEGGRRREEKRRRREEEGGGGRRREERKEVEAHLGETEEGTERPKTHFRVKSRITVMRRQMMEIQRPTLETICSGRFGGCMFRR